jgi:hypothetical protein
MTNSWNMDKRIKQLRAESHKLSAALVVAAELEGLGSWRTSGPGCGRGDRLRGLRPDIHPPALNL